MALAKMQAIAEHLLSKNLFAAEQFDWWMQNGTSEYASKKVGKGLVIGRFSYDAVLSVERFAGDAAVFLALINVWLMEHDDNREALNLEMPGVDVTPLDDSTADVEVIIRFSEDITLLPQDNGAIVFNGIRYGVAPLVIDEANRVGVGDNQERPTDLPYERD